MGAGGGELRGVSLRLDIRGGEGPRPQLLAAVMLSPMQLFLQQAYTDAENRSCVRPAPWVIQRTKSFFKTLPCLNTGRRGDRFCRHVMGKNPLPWVILKPLEIFGKCEELVPRIFSLINCFFKKWLREGRELCIFPPPSGSLSSALVFQYEEAKLFPQSPKWCLHIKNTPAFLAVCLRICFISYLTEASSLFRTHCTQLWGETGGGGKNFGEHHLFS